VAVTETAAVSRFTSTPARGLQHVDLAVGDIDRSLAFYDGVLRPLGLKERFRVSSHSIRDGLRIEVFC
jgi:catechol 2,3-dioxygenase-like lactoylglutathione lyase family enzyme